MATSGAQPGNNNAKKAKPWQAAIERAIAKRCEGLGAQKEALDELAECLLAKCGEGDISALKELGDRLDGKVAQSVHLSGEDGKAIDMVWRVEVVESGNE